MEHHFDTQDAENYGIKEAILLYNIKYWIRKNEANETHFYDGEYWTYNSVSSFSILFPYMTKEQIRRALENLEALGVIKTGYYNSDPRDRTRWFCVIKQTQMADSPNPHLVESTITNGNFAKCIIGTDNKHTDSKHTDIKEYNISGQDILGESIGDDFRLYISCMNEKLKKNFSDKRDSANFKKYCTSRKKYTDDELLQVFQNIYLDAWHSSKKHAMVTPEYCLRETLIEKYLNINA